VLDYIELNIKHKIKIYTSSTHKEQTTIYTVEDKPNQVYCSMNSMTETRIRDNDIMK